MPYPMVGALPQFNGHRYTSFAARLAHFSSSLSVSDGGMRQVSPVYVRLCDVMLSLSWYSMVGYGKYKALPFGRYASVSRSAIGSLATANVYAAVGRDAVRL